MKNSHFLEAITTKYLVFTVIVLIAITIGSFAALLYYQITDVDTLATFVDAVFKTVAILVGTIWTLNRYFVARTDISRFRVDHDVSIIRGTKFKVNKSALALLIYRLDLVNTGSTIILPYEQFLEIDAVTPTRNNVQYQPLYRWPQVGTHPGGPIEPNSWSAINDAISIPSDVKAVRLYLEIQLSKGSVWTWHKTFDVSGETNG
jgi:hypothetical protein